MLYQNCYYYFNKLYFVILLNLITTTMEADTAIQATTTIA